MTDEMIVEIEAPVREISGGGGESAVEAPPPIEILEIAIHVLDHRASGMRLTDVAVELTRPVLDLFSSYVVKGILSENARMARFLGPVLVRTVSTEIMGGSMSLVDGSQKMANLLFTAMQKRNPAAGDLAVVRAFDPSANHEMLAVLKLDLRTGFRREVVETAQGVKVRLQPVPDLMPDRDRRLQKAAFIPQPPHNYPYDLMVLDNQAGGREVGAAGFFVDDFLQCELLDGPRELTRRLPQEVEKWLQEESLAPGIALETREAVIQALHQPEVDLEVLANEAFHDSEHRSSFLDYMETAGFEGGGFSTDPAVADRIASTLTYILDGGVRISGDAETIAQILKVDPDPTDEGKARLVIESFRFERKY